MKFKVWDETARKFLKVEHFSICGNGDLMEIEDDSWVWLPVEGDKRSNLKISKSTGRPDKNGIELFSGDICLSSSGKKYEIRFWDNMLAWMVYDFESDTYDLLSDISHRIEKIGTKFENPELLEPKNV